MKRKLLFTVATLFMSLFLLVLWSALFNTGVGGLIEQGHTQVYALIYNGNIGIRVDNTAATYPLGFNCRSIDSSSLNSGAIESTPERGLAGISEHRIYNATTQFGNSKPWVDHSLYATVVSFNTYVSAILMFGIAMFWVILYRREQKKSPPPIDPIGFPMTV